MYITFGYQWIDHKGEDPYRLIEPVIIGYKTVITGILPWEKHTWFVLRNRYSVSTRGFGLL